MPRGARSTSQPVGEQGFLTVFVIFFGWVQAEYCIVLHQGNLTCLRHLSARYFYRIFSHLVPSLLSLSLRMAETGRLADFSNTTTCAPHSHTYISSTWYLSSTCSSPMTAPYNRQRTGRHPAFSSTDTPTHPEPTLDSRTEAGLHAQVDVRL